MTIERRFQFGCCHLVWLCCNRSCNNNRINHLHGGALRIVYSDNVSSFEDLIKRDQSVSILRNRTEQNLKQDFWSHYEWVWKFQHILDLTFRILYRIILETPKNIREVSVRSLKNVLVTYILITSINHVGYVNFQKTKCLFNENLTF